jgi:tRNA 2-thiocytidine biosynthesis protein TtcA
MPPKLISDDGRNTVIRPLLYAAETKIAQLAQLLEFPILPCDLCGSQDNLKRQQVKNLLAALEQSAPKLKESMLAALSNVRASHLLDAALWQRLGLHAEPARGDAWQQGDGDAPSPRGLRVLNS